eukprot:385876-Rhodomonas_salina.1
MAGTERCHVMRRPGSSCEPRARRAPSAIGALWARASGLLRGPGPVTLEVRDAACGTDIAYAGTSTQASHPLPQLVRAWHSRIKHKTAQSQYSLYQK